MENKSEKKQKEVLMDQEKNGVRSAELEIAYKKLWENNKAEVLKNNILVDRCFLPNDKRLGLTLLLNLNQGEIIEKLNNIINELRECEPEQYFYPEFDRHVTVLAIEAASEDFVLRDNDIEEYKKIISSVLEKIKQFNITFSGITASRGAVMITGYPDNFSNETSENYLEIIKRLLREKFSEFNIKLKEQYDDKSVSFAHSCFMRFTGKLKNPEKFVELIEKNRTTHFGKLTIKEMKFVLCDCINQKEKRKEFAEYILLK